MILRSPYPWFGGKSRVAHLVWPRLGNVPNFIEPFFGSGAVLLNRPTEWAPRVETVNDVDYYIANFWRAVKADPEAVAFFADHPVNEADLHARHRWLVEQTRKRIRKIKGNPDYYCAKTAGWWVWGQCLWIGSGWCASDRRRRNEYPARQAKRPNLANGNGLGAGVHRGSLHVEPQERSPRMGYGPDQQRRPQLTNDQGVVAISNDPPQRLHSGRGGRGVHRAALAEPWQQRPDLTGNRGALSERRWNAGGRGGGSGVISPTLIAQQIPQLSGDGSGANRGCLSDGVLKSIGLYRYFEELAARLRRVRVCVGDWKRVVTPAITTYIGVTAVFLDPPYSHGRRELCYSHDNDVAPEVAAWAIANGDDPMFRIALCGYEGEHKMPSTWDCVPWTAGGGYSRTERGIANRDAERIWFSPHCLAAEQQQLFPLTEATA